MSGQPAGSLSPCGTYLRDRTRRRRLGARPDGNGHLDACWSTLGCICAAQTGIEGGKWGATRPRGDAVRGSCKPTVRPHADRSLPVGGWLPAHTDRGGAHLDRGATPHPSPDPKPRGRGLLRFAPASAPQLQGDCWRSSSVWGRNPPRPTSPGMRGPRGGAAPTARVRSDERLKESGPDPGEAWPYGSSCPAGPGAPVRRRNAAQA